LAASAAFFAGALTAALTSSVIEGFASAFFAAGLDALAAGFAAFAAATLAAGFAAGFLAVAMMTLLVHEITTMKVSAQRASAALHQANPETESTHRCKPLGGSQR
jgi:hypothetical protein